MSWVELINAVSTVVMAAATVALGAVAFLQIRHRDQERREHWRRLDAIATYHGLVMRRRLLDAVLALDALRMDDRKVASWRQQASQASDLVRVSWTRLEEMSRALIERHSGAPKVLDELLQALLAASDAAQELSGPRIPEMADEDVMNLYRTARKQSLIGLNRLETTLGLPALPPIKQPPEAPGAVP